MHVNAPVVGEKNPAWQLTQSAESDEPVVGFEVPAEQLLHAVIPVLIWKLPWSQLKQNSIPGSGENFPGVHGAQSAGSDAPVAFRAVPSGHKTQAVAPLDAA